MPDTAHCCCEGTPSECPNPIPLYISLTGCIPARSCGPITVEITGPGVISPSSFDYWDGTVGALTPVAVDLTGIDLGEGCDAALEWEVTVTPPPGTGIEPVTATGGTGGGPVGLGATIALALEPPPGTVCVCLSPKPAALEFSDDWGSCTLTYGAPSNIYPWWDPWNGVNPLTATHPWIGSYSFECDDACSDPGPCGPYGGFGVSLERRTVSVVIAASCGEIIKIVRIGHAGCDASNCLLPFGPMDYAPGMVAICYLRGTFTPDCSVVVDKSGAWTMPVSQHNGCLAGIPGVMGNWTLTG